MTVGLRLNANKTTTVPLTKRRKMEGLRPMQLREELNDTKQEVKYRGLILDNKLLWNQQHAKNRNKESYVSITLTQEPSGKILRF